MPRHTDNDTDDVDEQEKDRPGPTDQGRDGWRLAKWHRSWPRPKARRNRRTDQSLGTLSSSASGHWPILLRGVMP